MSRLTRALVVLGLAGLLGASSALAGTVARPTDAEIVQAFAKQGMRLNAAEAQGIRANVLIALDEARRHGIGNSKVDFAAVEIAASLGLDTSPGSNTVRNVVAAIRHLLERGHGRLTCRPSPVPSPFAWESYFDETTNLWNEGAFMALVRGKGFFPVKISWEDIGRYQGSRRVLSPDQRHDLHSIYLLQ